MAAGRRENYIDTFSRRYISFGAVVVAAMMRREVFMWRGAVALLPERCIRRVLSVRIWRRRYFSGD